MIASISETEVMESAGMVANWERELEALLGRANRHVVRAEVRAHVAAYVDGLLSEVERRNSWQLAERAGERGPYGFQHVLGRAKWSAEGVRDELRAYAVERLQDAEAVWVLDETGFLKKGRASAGVKRQYSGTAGRVENCQIGVFLAYASCWGHTLVDRALYLPRDWAGDAARRQQAGIPQEVGFHTKPQLGQAMLERAWAAGLGGRWVTGDTVYGDNRALRAWLEGQQYAYVLAISSTEYIRLSVTGWAHSGGASEIVPDQWQRLSAGAGSQGPRWYDWAYQRVGPAAVAGWEHGLLLRRSLADGEPALYAVFVPVGTPVERLVQVAGQRWAVECSFQQAKALGLDQYEVRSWEGWHRHSTLVMLAQAALVAMRQGELKKTLWQWQMKQPLPLPRRRRPGAVQPERDSPLAGSSGPAMSTPPGPDRLSCLVTLAPPPSSDREILAPTSASTDARYEFTTVV